MAEHKSFAKLFRMDSSNDRFANLRACTGSHDEAPYEIARRKEPRFGCQRLAVKILAVYADDGRIGDRRE